MAKSALLQVFNQYVSEILSPVKMSQEEAEALDKNRMRPLNTASVRPVSQMEADQKSFERRPKIVTDKPAMLITMVVSGLILAIILGTTFGITYSRDKQILDSRAQEYQVTSTAVKLFNRLFPKEVTAEMWLSWNEDKFDPILVQQAKTNPDLRFFLYRYGTDQYVANRGDALTPEETNAAIPLLYQWDERWGFLPYGNDLMGISGDAPTVLSMLVVGLTGNASATPKAMIDLAKAEEIIVDGKPTDDFITWGGMKMGVYAEEIRSTEEDIRYCLDTGYPVTLRLGSSVFWPDEHYVIVVGYNGEGYRIYDPMSRANSEKIWAFSEFSGAIRNAWWCMWGI